MARHKYLSLYRIYLLNPETNYHKGILAVNNCLYRISRYKINCLECKDIFSRLYSRYKVQNHPVKHHESLLCKGKMLIVIDIEFLIHRLHCIPIPEIE